MMDNSKRDDDSSMHEIEAQPDSNIMPRPSRTRTLSSWRMDSNESNQFAGISDEEEEHSVLYGAGGVAQEEEETNYKPEEEAQTGGGERKRIKCGTCILLTGICLVASLFVRLTSNRHVEFRNIVTLTNTPSASPTLQPTIEDYAAVTPNTRRTESLLRKSSTDHMHIHPFPNFD